MCISLAVPTTEYRTRTVRAPAPAAESGAADAPDAAAGEASISFIASGYGSRTDYDAAVAAGADNDTLWAGDDEEPPLEGLAKVFAALSKPKADPVVPAYYAHGDFDIVSDRLASPDLYARPATTTPPPHSVWCDLRVGR